MERQCLLGSSPSSRTRSPRHQPSFLSRPLLPVPGPGTFHLAWTTSQAVPETTGCDSDHEYGAAAYTPCLPALRCRVDRCMTGRGISPALEHASRPLPLRLGALPVS